MLEKQLEFEFRKEERSKKNIDTIMMLMGAMSIIDLSDAWLGEHQIIVPSMITAATCLSYLIFRTSYLNKCTDYIRSLF